MTPRQTDGAVVGPARSTLIVVAVLLLSAAGKGVVDTFYVSPTREALAREAAGERLIGAAALLLLAVAAGFAVLRMTWSALSTAAAGVLFLLVVRQPDASLATYLMVPAAGLVLAGGVAADLVLRHRAGRRAGPARRGA